MLELNKISKVYESGSVNESAIFNDFNLQVKDGEFVTVVGSNGSGKTTLLNLICGSIPLDQGEIILNDQNLTKMPEYKRSRRIGRVFQDPAKGTCPHLSIMENMSIADNKTKRFNLSAVWICAENRITGNDWPNWAWVLRIIWNRHAAPCPVDNVRLWRC